MRMYGVYRLVIKTVLYVFVGCGLLMIWTRTRNLQHDVDSSNNLNSQTYERNGNEYSSLKTSSKVNPHISSDDNASSMKIDLPKPPKHLFNKDDYTATIDRRMDLYKKSCQHNWTNKFESYKNSLIMYDDHLKLAYCFVAKIGCTFWLRMLSFLTRPKDMKELGIKTPFDIDRSLLHTGQLGPVKWQRIWDFDRVAKPSKSTIRFFFTRNPYDRLWSVYLDKYYLIDYWVTNPIAETHCGLSVTFQRFLDVAVNSSDHHLVPIVQTCEPCAFRPDFIGKMETFSQDSKHLLNQKGYGYLLDGYNHSLYVNTELKSLIVYNFKAMRYPVFADGKCLSQKSLCRRLWFVFQRNGLIKQSVEFPENLKHYSEEAAIDLFLETVRDNPITKIESKHQRRDAIVKAYRDIQWRTIKSIQDRYRGDFEMFGYDTSPPT